jgi:hypothetical protein
MYSPNPCEKDMSDEAVVRAVLPRNGPKHLARLLAVPLETARHWYYRNLSAGRRREVALALLAELDAQDRQRAALRNDLLNMVGQDEMAGAGAGAVMQESRGAGVGATTSGIRSEVADPVAARRVAR